MQNRKKTGIILLFIVLLFTITTKSQNSKMTIIEGKIIGKKFGKEISLYSIVNGEAVINSTVNIGQDSTFGFCFSPAYSGLYRIGNGVYQARLYISPGKNTRITIRDYEFQVLNKDDKENLKLAEWSRIIRKLKEANIHTGNITYKDIFPILPDLEAQKDLFIEKLNTGNRSFYHLAKGVIQVDFEKELYHFLFMPRNEFPTFEQQPPIYKKYSSGPHFITTDVLNYDYGQLAVRMYLQYMFSIKANEGIKYSPELMEKLCIENIKNDTIKGWYLLNTILLTSKVNDQTFRERYERFKQFILSDDQKAILNKFMNTLPKIADNEFAIDFNGKTVDNKKVSLSDFKGKVVVVDVWATWCGPCKGEIPSLMKLEEDMKGKDVVFISYSIDEMKDHDKWLKFVADEKLGGIQLMGDAAWKSSICMDYKINAIPRFMVFTKKGEISTVDAPRPSQPALKELIEKLLK